MDSPAFSSFRDLLDKWDVQLERMDISDMLDKNGLILFFKKGGDLFGAPEESRVIFAKLKSDDDDDPMQFGFRDEARFPAFKLVSLLSDDPENSKESVFCNKDLPKIKVCSREDAIQEILRMAQEKQ